MIKNIWRWIKYYWRRKKIYLRDGTVLMPSIRLYDWLDFADGDQDSGTRLRREKAPGGQDAIRPAYPRFD